MTGRSIWAALGLALVAGALQAGPLAQSLRPVARAVPETPADPVAQVVVAQAVDDVLTAAAVDEVLTAAAVDDVLTAAAVDEVLTVAKAPLTDLSPPLLGPVGPALSFAGPALPALRPLARPLSDQAIAAAARPADTPAFSPETSLRPAFRPPEIIEQALFKKRARKKGSVCGDIDIQGDVVGNYGKGGGCFIPDAVRVKSVSGVRLSQSALMTCDTAKSLNTWVDKGLQPAFKKNVVEVKVAAHYACRTRNNKSGAKLSEHAKGRAIDISAFTLSNGKTVTVLNDWKRGKYGKALAKAHKAACGTFGTVLGPGSDRYHRDHFHFDTARYRSGAYCR